jgi:hypothetical protein
MDENSCYVSKIGDTNEDGIIDVLDYQELINAILADDHEQSESASYDDIIRYDIDADGSLDAIDASYMERMVNANNTTKVFAVGDIDHNGKAFEDADLTAIEIAIVNPAKLSTAGKYACDFNADGKVDGADLTVFQKKFSII